MNKSMKRLTALLILSGLAASIASCGSDSPEPIESTADAPTETTAAPEKAFPSLPDDLRFSGETINVLIRKDSGTNSVLWKNEFDVEAQTGDVVNDAVWKRNQTVSEFLDLKINYEKIPGAWNDKDDFLSTVRTSIMASDSAWDLIGSYQYYTPTLVTEGLYKNLYDYPYIDYSAEWWPDDFIDTIALKDKLYFITGSIALSSSRDMIVTFFNKKLADDFGIKPYELVKNGDWTIDKANELASLVAGDLNGDGKMTLGEDRFGYMNYSVGEYLVSGGTKPSDKNSEGFPEYRLTDERYVDVVTKLQSLLFDCKGAVSYPDSSAYAQRNSIFKNDQVLFFVTGLAQSDEFRDMNSDFGIIPIVKLDKEQENYYTRLADSYTVFGVPVDSGKDDELVGAFLEAMAYEGYKTVSPAYYSTVLKDKISRNTESIEMLEMIQKNLVYTFDYLYSPVLGDVGAVMRAPLQDKSVGFASYVASRIEAWQASLDNLVKLFDELN